MINSETLIEPEKLARDLVAFVNSAGIDDKSDKYWTQTVMKGLSNIADRLDVEALFTDRSNGVSEFMLDFVAWSRHGGEGIVLAAESEWVGWRRNSASYADEVAADFWKLLCVKSPIKLMVYASDAEFYPPEPILLELQTAFERYRHHSSKERYVFIDFAPSATRKAFYVEVPANVNHGNSVSFIPIPISLNAV